MENIIKEGQTLYLENTDPNAGRYGRSYQKIVEVKVVEVKRKYFKVVDGDNYYSITKAKFFIDTMRHDAGNHHSLWKAYFTREEIENKNLCEKLETAVAARFRNNYGKLNIPLNKLKQIAEILDLYDPYTNTLIDEKA